MKMEFDSLSAEHADYIHALIGKAAQADKSCKVFGSSEHKYQLSPAVSIKRVRQFEEKHQVRLPDEYVFFLTMVGNGGAGPFYGLYSLDRLENSGNICSSEEKPAFIDKNLTREAWAAKMKEMEDNEKYDFLMEELAEGMLVIGTQGCTFDTLLMCKGSERGKIVYIDWNLEEDEPPYFTHMTFLEWYESFFKEIIAGHKINWYGYYSLKSEKELRSAYKETLSLKEKNEIIKGFYKFREAEQETLDFLEHLSDSRLDANRTELLLELDFPRGQAVFEDLLAGKNPAAAVRCARSIPDSQKDKYYKRMVELLYEENECDKSLIIFYLEYCGCRSAGDLINFAVDGRQSEDDRHAAVWVIHQCGDKLSCLPQLIQLMRGDSYRVALEALLAVSMVEVKSKELFDTYVWMAEKYKEDRTMMSNLKVAMDTIKTVL